MATQQVSNYFVALSAVTINRNGRRDVSLEQHTVKPQPSLQVSPPVAPRASESHQGTAQVEFTSQPSALPQRSALARRALRV